MDNRRRLLKRGYDPVAKNTVEAVLFVLVFIAVIIIVGNWWRAYTSKANIPAVKSIENLQKSIERLDPNYPSITRIVNVETDEYEIKSFQHPELCGEIDGKALDCLCACKSGCDEAAKKPEKYCRTIKYPANIDIESDVVREYRVKLQSGVVRAT